MEGRRLTCAIVSLLLCYVYNCILYVLVWSNFEIADMDFWRGEAYTKFFEFLDSKGGFYYEVRLISADSRY